MRILGLVVEYNPFHLGHLHHLREAKRLVNPDATIAVMSGCFTQRGEPAITDKWTRAEMALRHGVDLVVELPVAWSVRSAPYFATGAVRLLSLLGATDICFGSEAGTLEPLAQTAEILLAEPESFQQALRSALSSGLSFATAQDLGLRAAAPGLPSGIFASPNNTLGIHYLLAIRQHQLQLTAHTISRTSSYDSSVCDIAMPSAKAVRQQLFSQGSFFGLPPLAEELLQRAMQAGRAPIGWHDFAAMLFYRLRQQSPTVVEGYPEAADGLGRRLHAAARQTNDLSELMTLVKTKRFTLTRLQRLCTYLLLDLTAEKLAQIDTADAPPYARILALDTMSRSVRRLLTDAELPIIFAAGRGALISSRAEACLALDVAATDCYSLAFSQSSKSGLDFTTPVIT